MVNISVKVKDRLIKGLKKYQPILTKACSTDINESDTVTIITDMLCEIFGYDKYENITSEYAIKKTYCDIAIKLNGKVPLLIECKAAGIDLKDDHIRQATNYAADAGIEWVVLSNGSDWKIYKILFAKPVEKQLVYEFNILEINSKKQNELEMVYYLCIEAFSKTTKSALDDLHIQKQTLNRFVIGQVLLTDAAVDSMKKLLHKLYPELKATSEELYCIIRNEIFKREIIEGEQAEDAYKKVAKQVKLGQAQKEKAAKQEKPKEPVGV
ncbi:MAG: restriction endonuclease subunit R [Firmicutes bacterium HGW-Firmicutes-21]|nr:MAG: restriction endonuclease subunit R [Firmicutes bacterium HGW-Firmicutes-21]